MARDDVIEDLYRQLNSLIRRSRELSNELHPGLSLIAHTFLNLVESTPEIQASDLVERLGHRQVHHVIALTSISSSSSGLLDREGGRPGQPRRSAFADAGWSSGLGGRCRSRAGPSEVLA